MCTTDPIILNPSIENAIDGTVRIEGSADLSVEHPLYEMFYVAAQNGKVLYMEHPPSGWKGRVKITSIEPYTYHNSLHATFHWRSINPE